jgi:ATP-dependent helicase/nuclease subunit B
LIRLPPELTEHLARGDSLLVPSRQRVRAVQLAYAAAALSAGRQVWHSPDVLTPAAFGRREYQRLAQAAPQGRPRLLSGAEEWALWREAAAYAARAYQLLDDGGLAESLQRAADLAAAWQLHMPRGAGGGETQLYLAAARAFEARCGELQATSLSAQLPQLQGRATGLWLRGFDAIPPTLAALAGGSFGADALRTAPPPPTARVVRTADAQAQLEAIAAWCMQHLRAAPQARLLVLLPGSAGARTRLATLIGAALNASQSLEGPARALVGIEGGQPFAQLPLPRAAFITLKLLAGPAIEVPTLAEWLRAPFFEHPPAPQRAALALLLQQRAGAAVHLQGLLGALQLVPPELKPAARELDGLLRRAAACLAEGSASPRRWSERIASALAAFGWPGAGARAEPLLRETAARFHELLEEFGELAQSSGSLSRSAALELLQALAQRTAYRPADEDVAVTLSPWLADPVVHYDGIWVADLSADVLPQPLAPDPFLPLAAQVAAGVPQASAAARRRQALTLLDSWRAATTDLVLSVPRREGDLELLPSPLLTGMAAADTAPASLWLPRLLARPKLTESILDERGPRFNPLTPLPGGTRALTLTSACAFRAFAELRLGAAPPEAAEPGIPMDQRGLLLHEALHHLWQRLKDSATLQAHSRAALTALIGASVAQAAQVLLASPRGHRRRGRAPAEGQFDLFSVMPPALTRECRRAESLILRLCELERARAPFAVEATEETTELALGGGRVRMRLDRIDRVAQGRIVLDYKSGRPGSPDWFGERPTHPQLLAYLAALGRDVVALATVNVTAREVRFTGVGAESELLPEVRALPASPSTPSWSAQQESWEALIGRLIGAFLAGDARVDPAPGACDYCHLSALCRIGAHRAQEVAARAEDVDE